MNCVYHPSVEAIAACAGCKVSMCGICTNFSDDGEYCDRCLAAGEAAKILEAKSQVAARPDKFGEIIGSNKAKYEEPRKASIEASIEKREKIHMAVVIVSVIFIAIRVVTSVGSNTLLTQQQIRVEEPAIEKLNNCVTVFWEIASELSAGRVPPATMACAETNDPNIITRNGEEVIITHPHPHPHPDLHGYKEIYVASSDPVPMFVLE